MLRICGRAAFCSFSPGQTTTGCPRSELCQSFCEPMIYVTTIGTSETLAEIKQNRTDEVTGDA